uniref:ABM domain-containing protein n=1 Tax=Aplanochytrium stocchinoi TaxID=215587 RepID=A0A7S3PQ85_9STRA|mmetsp:Transcript_11824/g.13450  ORF Transcript_11824/g.13450 Transcript_11824/m.13450 type:complete len:137 (+) Transcript_11824:80-490(+)
MNYLINIPNILKTRSLVGKNIQFARNLETTTILRKMAPICVLVQVEIKPDMVDEFLSVIEQDAVESRKEPGCLSFDVLQDTEKENKFVFYEAYKDAEAAEFHKKTPHYDLWAQFKGKGGVLSQNVIKCSGKFLAQY